MFYTSKIYDIFPVLLVALFAGLLVVRLGSLILLSIVVATVLNLGVSLSLMRFSRGLFLSQPTISGYAFLAFVLIVNIPSLIILLDNPQDDVFLLLWSAVQSATFLLALGAVYSSLVLGFSKEEVKFFWNRRIEFDSQEEILKKTVRYGLLACLLIVFFYVYRFRGKIPLFYLVTHPGDAQMITALREDVSKASLRFWEGYLIEWNRALLLPTLMSISFVMWRLTKQRNWLKWFILYLVLAVFFASLSTAKFPVLMIFIILGVTYALMVGISRITMRKAPLFVIVALFYPLVERMIKYKVGLIDALTFVVWERAFVVPVKALYLYFEHFPLFDGYLGGRSIRLVSFIVGKPYFNAANYVYIMRGDARVDTGLANSAFIGNLYADFGMVGVLIGAFVVGAFLQWAHIMVVRREKTPISVALNAFMVVLFAKIAIVPFPTLLLGSGGLIALVILLVFVPSSKGSSSIKSGGRS